MVTIKPPKGICGCENTSFGAKIVKIDAIVAEISRFFQYFQDGGCPPYWICGGTELVYPRSLLGSLYCCAKFGWIRCSRFDTVKVLVFRTFGLKKPIQAPKIGVFGAFYPLNGERS